MTQTERRQEINLEPDRVIKEFLCCSCFKPGRGEVWPEGWCFVKTNGRGQDVAVKLVCGECKAKKENNNAKANNSTS